MLLCRTAFAICALIVCCFAADQDVLTILKQQTSINTFIGFLEQFQDLVDVLNNGTFSGTSDFAHCAQTDALTLSSSRSK